MNLNQGQEEAAAGFFEYLLSNKDEFIISGPGGVGKTFLMGHLIDEVMPRYHETCKLIGLPPIYNEVVMTATTNKAAEVLGISTRRPTQTIHSFLNLRVTEDYSTGESKLAKGRNWKVHSYKIIFVDESSMIDRMLLKYLREGTHKCKVVFVGDHCQLPPVKEKLSPIYLDRLPFYELTQQMRNSGQPALMAVCQQLRQTVEKVEELGTGAFKPIHIMPGVIDHITREEDLENEIVRHFKNPSNHDRILAYSNKRVMQYNDYIRAIRNLPPLLTVGEHVINNAAMQYGSDMMSVEDEYEVVWVAPTTEQIEIERGVYLEVLRCDLKGTHNTFFKVPVPVDRGHYTKLVKYYAARQEWVTMYKLKQNYPDLRPRDAATVHKAQGSTYETVFIDLEDISTCPNPNVAARLLYVAFSRARSRIVLYGALSKKYGGIIA
jgi:exodeoxyribonuclease-5